MSVRSVRMQDANNEIEEIDLTNQSDSEAVMSGSEPSDDGYSCGDAADSDDGGAGGSDSEQQLDSDDATSEEANLGLADDAQPHSSKSLGYRVIDRSVLQRLQRAAVEEIASIWGCTPSIAKTLLMAYSWDKERLLSEWLTGETLGAASLWES